MPVFTLFRYSMDSGNHFCLNQLFKPVPALATRFSVTFILLFLLMMSFMVFPVLPAGGFEKGVLVIVAIIVLISLVVLRAPRERDELEARDLVQENRFGSG